MPDFIARLTASFRRVSTGNLACLGGLVVLAIAARWLPHPPNFTPVAAVGLAGGAWLASRWASALLVVTIMLVSDVVIGFHPLAALVYGCLVINVLLGHQLRRLADSSVLARIGGVAAASVVGSVLFFVATNLGHWAVYYEPTWAGLMRCYTVAVPFFQYTVAGDLFYSALLFGSYGLATARRPRSAVAVAA
ncbi:MAG: DUF6580 family putative transport protein [Planctomycetota bacterium]